MAYETEFRIEMLSGSAAGEEALREFVDSVKTERGWSAAAWPDRFEVVTMEFPYSPGSEFEAVDEWLQELKKAVPDVGYKGTFCVTAYVVDPPDKVFRKRFSHNAKLFKVLETARKEQQKLKEQTEESFIDACKRGDLNTVKELFDYSFSLIVRPDAPEREDLAALASAFSRLMVEGFEPILDSRDMHYYYSHVLDYGTEEDVKRIVLHSDLMSVEELSESPSAAMNASIVLERFPDITFRWKAISLCGKVEDADELRLAIAHSDFAGVKIIASDVVFLAENGLDSELEGRVMRKGKPRKATLQKALREVDGDGDAVAASIISRLLEAYYENPKTGSGGEKTSEAAVDQKKLRDDWCMSRDYPGAVSYRGTDRNVVVPEAIGKKEVTELNYECFAVRFRDYSSAGLPKNRAAREDIETVYVADTVKKIRSYAFTGCGARELSIPPTLETLEMDAWGEYGPFGNSNLKAIHIRAQKDAIPEKLIEDLKAMFEGEILDQGGNAL